MRLLAITDTHFRGSHGTRVETPQAFAMLQNSKLQQVVDYAIANNIEVIVHSGDFGDTKNWARANHIAIPIAATLERARSHGIAFVVTVGQHDVEGHQTEAYQDFSLGFFEQAGLLTVLASEYEKYAMSDGDIVGLPFGERTHALLTGELPWPYDAEVVIAHALIGDSRKNSYVTDVRDCKFTFDPRINGRAPKLVLLGDVHSGVTPVKVGDTVFASPGSLVRQASNETHTPAFFDVTVNSDGVKIKAIPVKSPTEPFKTSVKDVDGPRDLLVEWNQVLMNYDAAKHETRPEFVVRIQQSYGFSKSAAELLLSECQ